MMPLALRKAHQKLDRAVWEAYGRAWPINDESACVAHLMKLYLDNGGQTALSGLAGQERRESDGLRDFGRMVWIIIAASLWVQDILGENCR